MILKMLKNNLDLRRYFSALGYKNFFIIKIKNSFFLIPTKFFLIKLTPIFSVVEFFNQPSSEKVEALATFAKCSV